MNEYRVDRANSLQVPCGANSIVYIGDSFEDARYVYNQTDPGKDAWNQPNATYGVLLSVWNPDTHDYRIKCSKGLY